MVKHANAIEENIQPYEDVVEEKITNQIFGYIVRCEFLEAFVLISIKFYFIFVQHIDFVLGCFQSI